MNLRSTLRHLLLTLTLLALPPLAAAEGEKPAEPAQGTAQPPAQAPQPPPAQGTAQPPPAPPTESPEEAAERTTRDQLGETTAAIYATQQDLAEARAALKKAKDEQEKQHLTADIERLSKRLSDQRMSFEKLATGGVDTRVFYEGSESKFDLQQDFEEVVRPLLIELKKLTELPRMLERLRGEQRYLQVRLEVAEAAVAKIEQLRKESEGGPVRKELNALAEQWQQRRDDTASKLKLVDLQMKELLNPNQQGASRLGTAAAEFFSGRGLSLLLGLGAFVGSYLLFLAGTRQLQRRLLRTEALRSEFWPRIVILVAQIASLAVSLFLTMVVLYVRGDWLILALVIIFMLGGGWTLRQSLPRYLMESRILLNMGPVRDGERVIFRGIPWQITSLNVFSTLYNPCLRGATIRLSLGEMARLHSRPFGRDEPWFPSREGDFVMLEGDLYGKVLMQTPEVVQLQAMGSVKTFGVEAYLAANPRNLSSGFSVAITFGLDYVHQREITGPIIETFGRTVRERLAAHPVSEHLIDSLVDYNAASASSLDLLLVAIFQGQAAEQFFAIRRLLQRIAIDACNEHGWVVPFNQLTVHVAESGAMSLRPAGTPWGEVAS